MKKNAKNKLLYNFGYKILSVIFAIILWIAVINISDSIVTKQIDNIPVEQLNGDVLEELDKIYEVSEGDTVDIIVKGRRSIVGDLSAADFNATADLSTMSITNSVQINVAPKNYSIADEISITCLDNTMKLNLEEKVTMQFPVKVKFTGTPYEGYAVGGATASPNIITIEGPKSTVEKITEVTAAVMVDGAKEDFKYDSKIVLYDAYGDIITSEKLTMSHDEVSVSVLIYPVKTVNVAIKVKGSPADGYGIAEVIYQPQSIDIAGLPEKIQNIGSIEINDIYVSGITEDLQTTVDLKEYLDDGIVVADTDTEIVVTVKIEELKEKTFSPTDKHITLNNKQNGYKYKLILSDDFKVSVTGVSGVVNDINLNDINLYIDCTNLAEGEHRNVKVLYEEPEGLDYEIQGTVTLEVTD